VWDMLLGQLIQQERSDGVSRKYNEERSRVNEKYVFRYGIHPFGRTSGMNCVSFAIDRRNRFESA
jgi:hypothetical protein